MTVFRYRYSTFTLVYSMPFYGLSGAPKSRGKENYERFYQSLLENKKAAVIVVATIIYFVFRARQQAALGKGDF